MTTRWISALIVLAALSLSALPAFAQDNKGKPEKPTTQKVTLDFHKAPLENVVQFYSTLMTRNFIVSAEVTGKTITVYAPRPVSLKEAYGVFLTALAMNGLQLVRVGQADRPGKSGVDDVGQRQRIAQDQRGGVGDGGVLQVQTDRRARRARRGGQGRCARRSGAALA